MDNDVPLSGEIATGLPKAGAFAAGGSASASASAHPRPPSALVASGGESGDRTGIFGNLVKDDSDIAGLVAYSIYKQNKLDWLRAFEAARGRAPDEAELAAYIVGEGTARRLATYRHLAEATLAGNGPDVDGTRGPGSARTRKLGGAEAKMLTNGLMLTYGLIAVLFVIVLWFAVHLTH